jgi:hypothetical protein
MTKPIEEILAPKPEARPRIYAYSIDDAAHQWLLKVGQTTRDVKQRVAEPGGWSSRLGLSRFMEGALKAQGWRRIKA